MTEHKDRPPAPRVTLEELIEMVRVTSEDIKNPISTYRFAHYDRVRRALRELIEIREAGERRRKEMWDALRRGPAGEEERIG